MEWKRLFDNSGLDQGQVRQVPQSLRRLFRGPGQRDDLSVNRLFLAVNLILFAAMVVQGLAAGQGLSPLINPDTYLLIHVGAQYWPLVLVDGEWWRCLTYAFTHGGLIHLGFNMMVLYQVGPLIEYEIGRSRFTVLYLATALTATAAGYFWHPQVPVVGASGSLFGLIGFAAAWFHRRGDKQSLLLRNFMLRWAAYAFVFGLLVGADNAGHFGGALGGVVLGGVMPLRGLGRPKSDALFNLLAAAGFGALALSLILLVRSWFSH